MRGHTAGPWRTTVDKFGQREIEANGVFVGRANAEDAARIVACVNACEGMEDPQKQVDNLRLFAAMHEGNTDPVGALRAERDKLRAALEECITDQGATGYTMPKAFARNRLDAISDIARAALELSE